MAEESKENQVTQETQNEGSWWGSWISSAKNKTSTVFEAVKKDLDELSSAVRTEASNVGAAIESTLKFNEETSPVGNVKKSLSTFFGQVTEALIPSIDDDDVEAILIRNDDLITLTGFQKHLADLQFDDQTYLNEPDNELKDKYKLWMEVIEQDQFTQDRLAKHLANSEILNEKYLTHVPDNVSHMDFWQRYLFRRALLEDALANAEIAERRAKNEINSIKPLSPRKNIIQTEQPKLTCIENDIINTSTNNDDNNVNVDIKSNDNEKIIDDNHDKIKKQQKLNKTKTTIKKSSSSASKDNSKNEKNNDEKNVNVDDDDDDDDIDDDLIDDNINWDNEEIPNNVELSEEEQIRLLEQYEQEIQEREKKRNENNSNNKGKKNKTTTSATKSSSSNQKSNNLKQQSTTTTATPTTKSINQQQNKRQNLQNKNKNSNKINNLIIQKDHFNKDETSSTSDESWEKDFDLND